MRLADVYSVADSACYLYALLLERDESINISHRVMPSVAKHLDFIRSVPYREWWLIVDDLEGVVGATYLTKQNEIGIFVFKAYKGRGFGTTAVQMLIERHRGERLLANINPSNTDSISFFAKFRSKLIQHTYEVPA